MDRELAGIIKLNGGQTIFRLKDNSILQLYKCNLSYKDI